MRLSLAFSSAALLGFALTSFAQGPAISPGGIVNAASFVPGQSVSAGSLAAIFGTNLAPGLAAAASVPLPTSLSNVTVMINGINAPLDFVSTGQINVQIPFEVAGSPTVNVVVNNNGSISPAQTLNLAASAPGVFAYLGSQAIAVNVTDPTSQRYATISAPSGSIPGLTTFPARVGDILFLYATGLGPTDHPVPTGQGSGTVLASTTSTPVVMVGGANAQVLFSGLTSSFPGVYQVNFVIPQVNTGNAVPLQIQMGGITSPATTTIAIQ
jgi:uncharacterized protein (TIGR03437 family)